MKMMILNMNMFMILSLFGIGCTKDYNYLSKHISIQKYVKDNFTSYKDIYDELKIEIDSMILKKTKSIKAQIGHEYKIDSFIVFNKERTKLYTTVNTNFKEYKGTNDYVQSLYGVKIKGKWHVYLGYNLIAMRGGYKTNIYEPFTCEELSYIAHEQMFGRFIGFDKVGKMTPRPDLIDTEIDPWKIGGTSVSKDGTEEERFLRLSYYNQSRKIDSLEYQELLNEVNHPAPKEREAIKKLSWWDKLWGAEVPIFDSKEWKAFVANKLKAKS